MRSSLLAHLSGVVAVVGLATLPACHDAAHAPATSATAPATALSLDTRRQQLRAAIADEWEYNLRVSPEFASILGDKRYNDRWSDVSDKATRADLEVSRGYVAKLRAIDTTGFPEQERLDAVLLVRQLELELEGARFER